jgi:hypothetical protein
MKVLLAIRPLLIRLQWHRPKTILAQWAQPCCHPILKPLALCADPHHGADLDWSAGHHDPAAQGRDLGAAASQAAAGCASAKAASAGLAKAGCGLRASASASINLVQLLMSAILKRALFRGLHILHQYPVQCVLRIRS